MPRIDLSTCNDLRWLSTIVGDIAVSGLVHTPLLVGALARDIHLLHAHGISTGRATADADFAIAISDWDEYQSAKDILVASGRFRLDPRQRQRLQHQELWLIDLIPFGEVEAGDGSIAWPPNGNPVMNVIGYREAMDSSLEVAIPNGQHVRVVSLAMLIALKLLAWNDRAQRSPGRDAPDLRVMLNHYLDVVGPDRFPIDAPELFGANYDYTLAGALLAGRDVIAAIHTSRPPIPATADLVTSILDRESAAGDRSRLVWDMAGTQEDQALQILSAFRLGLDRA
jgi:predicted nucleotidyltransferase